MPIIIHPAHELNSDAFIDGAFWVITLAELKRLSDNIIKFFNTLGEVPFDDLTAEIVNQKLAANELDTVNLMKLYFLKGCKKP